jgi:hypothetical protein
VPRFWKCFRPRTPSLDGSQILHVSMSHNNKSDLHHASSSRIGVLVFFTTAIGAEDDRVEMWQVGELLGGIVSLGRGCICAVRLLNPDLMCNDLLSQ